MIAFVGFSYPKPTEEYAEKTGLSCERCHLDSSGGSELTEAGEEYLEKLLLETEDSQQGHPPIKRSLFAKYMRFIAGWLHIFTAIFWFGTILYVHLILKPAYAAHGLPKGEVRVGLVSMAVMGVTGLVLTHFRVTSLSMLFETRFGILLMAKIGVFLLMVFTAVIAVFVIGPRLREKKRPKAIETKSHLTLEELKAFDGKDNRPAYFAFQDKVYDVSESEFWKEGIHFERHRSGEDLTEFLRQAPHGEEKILSLPQVAKSVSSEPTRTAHEKAFYVLAYFNLAAVFLIILILALWRWW
jgi:predicted heme/steroid binding protein/uncharacterized membrane protein